MAIARDIESVSSNWGGTVLNRGHSDNVPANSLAASTDNNPYSETGQTSGEQKRIHTLSNGQIIWDFAGNIWEWVDDALTLGQQYVNFNGQSTGWYEYNGSPALDFSSAIYFPYSLAGPKGVYNSTNGIGKAYISPSINSNQIASFIRGGCFNNGFTSGVFALQLNISPTPTNSLVGFRCVK